MGSSRNSRHEEDLIPRLAAAVYPSFALLAGMQLDLFTPLRDGPMSVEQIAAAIGVRSTKLKPLLYALAAVGLLNVAVESYYFITDQSNNNRSELLPVANTLDKIRNLLYYFNVD